MTLSWSKRTDGEDIVWICYVVGHKANTKITILCSMTPCSFVGTCFPYVRVQSLSGCQVRAYHYTKNVREVRGRSSQRQMQLIHCIFIFNTIPQHTAAFVPSWHEFKISDAVEIGIVHSQPLTNNHFPFFILVQSATSLSRVASAAQTNDSPPLSAISPSIVSLMCWVDRCDHEYGCPIGHFVTTCTIS